LLSVVVLAAGLTPAAVSACLLNNTSSLSANGYAAQKNLDARTPGEYAAIPFVFTRVYGRGTSIRFAENFNDLSKSLSPAALSHPFVWRWGDGTYTVARAPSHPYLRAGTYLISIYATGTSDSGDAWSPFDRAQIRIVPPGEVWRDNLGEDALDAFDLVFSWTVWMVLGGIGFLLAWGFFLDFREKRRERVQPQAATSTSMETLVNPDGR
jgi:hypothetical protein